MKRLSVLFALVVALTAVGCKKAEEPKATTAPKAAAKPTEKSASTIEQETLEACLKRNPDNAAYCRCYSNELGKRYAEKAKTGEVSVQERGQIAVQSAMACKQQSK